MAFGLGGNVVEIIIRAKDEFSDTMNSVSKSLKSYREGFLALTAIGGGITAIGIASVKTAGELQKNTIAFETMLGSGEKANKMLQNLSKFAKKTPFQIPEIRQAAKQLLAVGIEADDLIPTLKSLGDIAAGTGGDFDRIVLNLGQVVTQGKLTGREMMDFQRNMVPITAGLAKHFGVMESEIADMVSSGKISSQDVIETFEEMTSAGGMFDNMMFKLSDTVPGTFSNMQDSITGLSEAIGKIFTPSAKELLDEIIPIIDRITLWITENPKLASAIIFVTGAIGLLLVALGGIGLVVPYIIAGIEILTASLGVLIPVLAGTAIAGAPVWAVVLAITAAIVGVIAIILYWKEILLYFAKVATGVVIILMTSWMQFGDTWTLLWAGIKNVFAMAWNFMIDLAYNAANTILDLMMPLINVFNKLSRFFGGPTIDVGSVRKELDKLKGGLTFELTDMSDLAKELYEKQQKYEQSLYAEQERVLQGLRDKLEMEEKVTDEIEKQGEATRNISSDEKLLEALKGFKVLSNGDIYKTGNFSSDEFQTRAAFEEAKKGLGIEINIENLNGLDPDEIAQALGDKLREIMAST